MGQTTDELRRDVDERRQDISRDLDAIGDKVSPKQAARRTTQSARQRVHDLRDTVMGTAESGASGVADVASSARDQVQQLPDMARRQTEGNPLAVGLVAFGGGLLLASLIKPTQREQQLAAQVQPGLEHAAAELRHTGEELAGELQEPAREAVESAGQSAKEAAQSVASGSSSGSSGGGVA
jgi:hypothetical protein